MTKEIFCIHGVDFEDGGYGEIGSRAGLGGGVRGGQKNGGSDLLRC